MPADDLASVLVALSSLAGLTIACAATLVGWRGWLELKRLELGSPDRRASSSPSPAAARIELADLKARVRKLEAIASGIEP